ncbi:hypothetical protein J7E38_13980 [Bacillus sp. ISL-35]|uniref:hypothetical protein n=1 Tax=Bacillus sp. ISL-35 TaxID=2819122 RepID=UPI001BE621B6|nr:hypothetical protein [Bacillus sp. ISL-35]MBT2680119.1 hypothetical protein [Bacillus sp. ISL-35]MBT2704393.1 hypothetical protein [Chryseobacterium sp. ISL-80]
MAQLTFKSENTSNIILVSAIILIISSLFMPLVFVYFIQDYLYLTKDKWFYVTPPSAYILFMVGMLWLAVTLLLYLFVQWKFEWGGFKWLTILLMLGSVPFFMFSISNYYYLNDKGLHFNEASSFNEVVSYGWKDIKEAKEIFVKNKGVTVSDHYLFTTNNGTVIELPNNSKVTYNKQRIMEKLQEFNIPLNNNMGDLYE